MKYNIDQLKVILPEAIQRIFGVQRVVNIFINNMHENEYLIRALYYYKVDFHVKMKSLIIHKGSLKPGELDVRGISRVVRVPVSKINPRTLMSGDKYIFDNGKRFYIWDVV